LRTSALDQTAYLAYGENGNQTKVVAPGGEVSTFGYDALDRRSSVRAELRVRGRTQAAALAIHVMTPIREGWAEIATAYRAGAAMASSQSS